MVQKSHFPFIFMFLLSITPLLSLYFPRFMAFWPLILGLVSGFWLIFIKKELFTISKTYYICAAAISALCLASAAWSIAPASSLSDAGKVSAILLFGGLTISSFKALEIEDFKPYGWMPGVGVITAALFCIFDLYNDLYIYKIFHDFHAKTNSSVMNRGVICSVLACFISLPFIQYLDWKEKPKIFLTFLLVAAMSFMLALSQSQASQLAFITGMILFFIFPLRSKTTYIFLRIGLFTALLATPAIINFLYDSMLIDYDDAPLLIKEAYIGNRLEIWHFVMEYAMSNPFFGHGIEATNYVEHFNHEHLYNKYDTVLHPHNFAVQIWMEFGLLGIVVTMAILNSMLIALYNVKDIKVCKILTSLFISVVMISSFTYGLWQSWWLGEFIFLLGMGGLISQMRLDKNASPKEQDAI